MSDHIGLDPLSEQLSDVFDPGIEHMCDILDGDIYAQGIKIGHRDWLDMGSEGWQQTPDAAKAAAYQVAIKIGGWDEARLKGVMLRRYKHLKGSMMEMTLETLQSLAIQYPLHIEDVSVQKANVGIEQYRTPMESKLILPPEHSLNLELGFNWSSDDPNSIEPGGRNSDTDDPHDSPWADDNQP